MSNTPHRYSVHLAHEGPHSRSWVAEADSFIDAAIRFAETTPVTDGEASIEVTDCETGGHRCFVVNLGTGEIAAC